MSRHSPCPTCKAPIKSSAHRCEDYLPKPPETRPASRAIQMLAERLRQDVAIQIEQLGAVALEDAQLKASDGWKFDVNRACYVKAS